jgi:hypothetical protein
MSSERIVARYLQTREIPSEKELFTEAHKTFGELLACVQKAPGALRKAVTGDRPSVTAFVQEWGNLANRLEALPKDLLYYDRKRDNLLCAHIEGREAFAKVEDFTLWVKAAEKWAQYGLFLSHADRK